LPISINESEIRLVLYLLLKKTSRRSRPRRPLAFRAALSNKSKTPRENCVPSLVRFLLLAAILAGIVYGGMIALVNFVEPQPREMTQTIPPARLNK
jgi:hypothetical protein